MTASPPGRAVARFSRRDRRDADGDAAALLRFLETQRYFRVGGTQELSTDVRFIAATNRSPVAAVRENRLQRGPVLPDRGLPDRVAAFVGAVTTWSSWRNCSPSG